MTKDFTPPIIKTDMFMFDRKGACNRQQLQYCQYLQSMKDWIGMSMYNCTDVMLRCASVKVKPLFDENLNIQESNSKKTPHV